MHTNPIVRRQGKQPRPGQLSTYIAYFSRSATWWRPAKIDGAEIRLDMLPLSLVRLPSIRALKIELANREQAKRTLVCLMPLIRQSRGYWRCAVQAK